MSTTNRVALICLIFAVALQETQSKGKKWWCPYSQHICECHSRDSILYTADCHNRGLRSIPVFDQKFQRLNFSENFLYELNKTTFTNIKSWNITELFLKKCSIETITEDTFDGFHLDFIDFSLNDNINISQLGNSFRKMTLKGLDLSGIPLGQRTIGFFNTTASMSLVFLRLASCELSKISKAMFTYLQNLTEIDLSRNKLNVIDLTVLPPISFLTIKNIGLSELPNLNNPLAGNLKYIDIGYNSITDVRPFQEFEKNLHRLENLLIDSNPLLDLPPETFSKLSSLHTLSLCNVTSNFSSFKGIYSLSIKDLNMSNNFIHTAYAKQIFQFSKNIKKLRMQDTSLSLWTDDDIYDLFLPLCGRLQELHMQSTYFRKIPSKTFRCFHRLETLDISSNNITGWSSKEYPFKNVNISEHFRIKDNLIKFINESSFPESYMNGHYPKHFDFHGNPFSCSCHAHWFRQWMKENYYRLGGPFGTNIVCKSPEFWENKPFVEYDPTYEDCFGNSLEVTIALGLCGLCIVLITMATYLKKYRSSF